MTAECGDLFERSPHKAARGVSKPYSFIPPGFDPVANLLEMLALARQAQIECPERRDLWKRKEQETLLDLAACGHSHQ